MNAPKPIGKVIAYQDVNARDVVLETRDDVVNYAPGDEVVLSPYDLRESGVPHVRVGKATVVKIDRVAGRLTFEANLSACVPAAASGDYLYHAGAVEAWRRAVLAKARAIVVAKANAQPGGLAGLRGAEMVGGAVFGKLAEAQAEIDRRQAAFAAAHWVDGPGGGYVIDPSTWVLAQKLSPSLDPMGFPKSWRLAHAKACDCADCGQKPGVTTAGPDVSAPKVDPYVAARIKRLLDAAGRLPGPSTTLRAATALARHHLEGLRSAAADARAGLAEDEARIAKLEAALAEAGEP
jgi:hypothetical protein